MLGPGRPRVAASHERNYVRMMFTEPRMKDFYDDWEGMARTGVALLRMQAVDNPTDPRLAALVGQLSLAHPLSRRWWAARNVARQEFGTKTIHHPDLGVLTFDWDGFQWAGDPDQQLIIWSAEPGSPTHDKLRILSSWLTTPSTQETPTSRSSGRSLCGLSPAGDRSATDPLRESRQLRCAIAVHSG